MLELEQISPDAIVFWRWGPVQLNATLVFTWAVMGLLVLGSLAVTARLDPGPRPSRWQLFLEMVVELTRDQIREVMQRPATPYLPFIGTLALFIGVANLLMIVPGYVSPTASLSTTAALAGCVFLAVPAYGIRERGLGGYLKHYVEPSWFMLPFHVISELSRTLALAVRLFGNIMSGTKVAALLVAISPLLFPVVLQILGLITGMVQAYIFAVLALIYIASAVRSSQRQEERRDAATNGGT